MSAIVGTSGNDSLTADASTVGSWVIGLEGSDTLISAADARTLDGMDGDDVLIGTSSGMRDTDGYGGDGDDLLQQIHDGFGDAGNDTIVGTHSAMIGGAFLHGGAGDDSIVGTSATDFLSGGGGTDVIMAGDGNDVFMMFDMSFHSGWSGYSKGVIESGDPGFTTIDGGAGHDTLRLSEFWGNGSLPTGDMIVDLAAGFATTSAFTINDSSFSDRFVPAGRVNFTSFESVETGSGNDSIKGAEGSERLRGGRGSDTIFGGGGSDTIEGDASPRGTWPGSDSANFLYGESGDDSLAGSVSSDRLEGGAGADTLEGRNDADVLLGGEGDDSLNGGAGADTLTGGAGADRYLFASELDAHAAFADTVLDWSSDDSMDFYYYNGGGYVELTAPSYDAAYDEAQHITQTTEVRFVATQVGADVIIFANNTWAKSSFGNSGMPDSPEDAEKILDQAVILRGRTLDDISAAQIKGAFAVDLSNLPATPSASFQTISSEAALTVAATDKITFAGGATQASVLYGSSGVTVVMGGTSVTFGPAISAISKANGLIMADRSQFYIGDGADESFVGAATADAAFGGLGADTLDGALGGDLIQGNQGDDHLIGGGGEDTVYGGQDQDALLLGAGRDFGQGNRGRDTLYGATEADTLLGGQDNDIIDGGLGDDFLNGNRGDDYIIGGDGNDTIYGESGADTLAGKAGADVFHAFIGQELDTVVDFNIAEGDRIVLPPGATYSVEQVGADTVISLGASDSFLLVGVSLASLTGNWIGQ